MKTTFVRISFLLVALMCMALVFTVPVLFVPIPVAAAGLTSHAAASALDVTQILAVIAGLVGLPALWSLLIDILKWAGIVTDGNAGKWSAALNLITLIGVTVVVQFFPDLNIGNVDNKLVEIAKFATLIFGYFIQILDTKAVHLLTTKVLGITAFSYSSQMPKAMKAV